MSCFPCTQQHQPTEGNRTAFVLLDKLFGKDLLILPDKQVNLKNIRVLKHINYVITRATSVTDFTEILLAELAESTKAIDTLKITRWEQLY